MKWHILSLYEAQLDSTGVGCGIQFGKSCEEVGEAESERFVIIQQLFSDRKPKIINHLPGFVGWLPRSRQVAVNEQGVCCEQCERLE